MCKVGIIVFTAVKINNGNLYVLLNGIGWLTSFVSMYEVFFPICFVSGEHTVDVPDCAA